MNLKNSNRKESLHQRDTVECQNMPPILSKKYTLFHSWSCASDSHDYLLAFIDFILQVYRRLTHKLLFDSLPTSYLFLGETIPEIPLNVGFKMALKVNRNQKVQHEHEGPVEIIMQCKQHCTILQAAGLSSNRQATQIATYSRTTQAWCHWYVKSSHSTLKHKL